MILKGLADNSSSTKGSVQLRSKWYGPTKEFMSEALILTKKNLTDKLVEIDVNDNNYMVGLIVLDPESMTTKEMVQGMGRYPGADKVLSKDEFNKTVDVKKQVEVKPTYYNNYNKPKGELKSNVKDNFIIKYKGKDFMLYGGLLDKAHTRGLNSMDILREWVSPDMTMAWCIVRVIGFNDKNEEVFFDGFGSSTPANTGTMTKVHPVEMAHTRAKGRALRDFLNISMVMKEELKGEDE